MVSSTVRARAAGVRLLHVLLLLRAGCQRAGLATLLALSDAGFHFCYRHYDS